MNISESLIESQDVCAIHIIISVVLSGGLGFAYIVD